MNANLKSLAVAVGLVSGLVYVVCYLFLIAFPGPTIAFFSLILHEDVSAIHPLLTWGSFITGLLFWGVGPAVYVALIGRVFGLFQPK
jgi:hypothetical protein